MPQSIQNIDPKLRYLFEQMPGVWGCKDENSIYTYANAEYSRIVGFPNHADIIGKTDFDVPCELVDCAELFIAQDKKVMQTAKPMRILGIHLFAGHEWKAYIFTKAPLKDENNKTTGTIFQGVEVTNSATIEIGSLLTKFFINCATNYSKEQINYTKNDEYNEIKFTKRQLQVLFFLLRGKTVKQIAVLLGLSHRTVDDYLKQLKIKFIVKNKHILIDKAINNGFLSVIPEGFFRTQLSIELNE